METAGGTASPPRYLGVRRRALQQVAARASSGNLGSTLTLEPSVPEESDPSCRDPQKIRPTRLVRRIRLRASPFGST